MIKNIHFLSILVTAGLSCAILTNVNSAISLSPIHSAEFTDSDSKISPMSDAIEWRYKIENGKVYKRLYNYTTQQWIGDWILVS